MERTLTAAQGTTIMADDAALAAAAKEDSAAFGALYRRYATRVYRYCYMQCGNEQDAEDLTAQTFLAAMESLDRYRERVNPRAPDPERQAFRNTILDCVLRTLPQLTPDRQEVLRLRYGAGLSTAETAAMMGKGQSAVKMLLLRAVDDLRKRCLDEAE